MRRPSNGRRRPLDRPQKQQSQQYNNNNNSSSSGGPSSSSVPVTIILSTDDGAQPSQSLRRRRSWRRRKNRKPAAADSVRGTPSARTSESAVATAHDPMDDDEEDQMAIGAPKKKECDDQSSAGQASPSVVRELATTTATGSSSSEPECGGGTREETIANTPSPPPVITAAAELEPSGGHAFPEGIPEPQSDSRDADNDPPPQSIMPPDPHPPGSRQASTHSNERSLQQQPMVRKLAKELRENFNLSAFLFTTTPHLLRFGTVPPAADFSLVGAAHRFGAAAAAIIQKGGRHPAPGAVAWAIRPEGGWSSNDAEDVQEIGGTRRQQPRRDAYEEDDPRSSDDLDSDSVPPFHMNETLIDTSSLTSFVTRDGRPTSTADWFLGIGPDRQASLVGLLNGLGLTSHLLFPPARKPPENNTSGSLPSSSSAGPPTAAAPGAPLSPSLRHHPPRLAFCLSSLWQSFEEASCYGVETPTVDLHDGTCSSLVFVPYLSALQLTAAPSMPVSFSYFESKPPHVRRPFTRQIERLAAGLEVPVSADQRRLLLDATTDDLTKEDSWVSIYWMPLQQKDATNSTSPPPSFLVYYAFAATDDPMLSGAAARRPTPSQAEQGPKGPSPKLEGLMSATPQLVRFGVLPHRIDLHSWGVQSTAERTTATVDDQGTTPASYQSSGPLRHVTRGLQEWLEAKGVVHPDYEFIRRRLKL